MAWKITQGTLGASLVSLFRLRCLILTLICVFCLCTCFSFRDLIFFPPVCRAIFMSMPEFCLVGSAGASSAVGCLGDIRASNQFFLCPILFETMALV